MPGAGGGMPWGYNSSGRKLILLLACHRSHGDSHPPGRSVQGYLVA